MRFATTLVLSALSFSSLFSPVFARNSKYASRVISSRQHRQSRDLLDVCAYVAADVPAPISVLGILGLGPIRLDVCLCLSALPLYIESNIQLKLLASVLGEDAVAAILKLLINDAPGSNHCSYPPHSKPICSASDPCGFTCDPPYVKEDICVCPPPLMECNGVCAFYPKGCSSAVPRAFANNPRIRTAIGITTLVDAQATCKADELVCGVVGGSKRGFECLNVKKSLESCGGCVKSNPFLSHAAAALAQKGTDCSAIENVSEVKCEASKCVIKKCKDGFKLSHALNLCVLLKVDLGHGHHRGSHESRDDAADIEAFLDDLLHDSRRQLGLDADVFTKLDVLLRRGLDLGAAVFTKIDILLGKARHAGIVDADALLELDALLRKARHTRNLRDTTL